VSLQNRPRGPHDLVSVEAMGNCPRRLAGYELSEYPADDPGLDLIDPPAAMDGLAAEVLLPDNIVPVESPPPDRPSRTRPSRPRCVLAARSLRKRAFIVPLRPTCNSLISPSARSADAG